MELKMDEVTYAVAVETTAQVDVLRTAFVVLATKVMAGLPEGDREALLKEIEEAAASATPHSGVGGSTGSAISQDAHRAMPGHARTLVQDIRQSAR